MPDQNGIMTPQEVADIGVNALLKVRAAKQQDEQMRQQQQLFQQQLQSGELEHKLKMQEFDQKEFVKRILAQGEKDPKTGLPSQTLLPGDLQRLHFLTGIGQGPQAMDYLPAAAQPAAAGTQLGLIPNANTTAQVGAETRGQDIQHQSSKNALTATFIDAGANPFILSQGDVEDPKTIAKAFEGVEPSARLNAYANVLQAKAAFLHASTNSEIEKASASLSVQESKDKTARLKVFNDALGKQLGVAAQLENSGGTDAEKAASARAISVASSAVAQEMAKQGYALPAEVAPSAGGFMDWLKGIKEALVGPSASAPGGIDINKLVGPDGKINLDQEMGASPAPGAALPLSAAPPTTSPTSAATAPNSPLSVLGPEALQLLQDLNRALPPGAKLTITGLESGKKTSPSTPNGQ